MIKPKGFAICDSATSLDQTGNHATEAIQVYCKYLRQLNHEAYAANSKNALRDVPVSRSGWGAF